MECKNDKLKELMALDFKLYDLQLYLNTHPDDIEAIEEYKELVEEAEMVKKKYEEVLAIPDVIGLNIATRCDAISDECLDYLTELNKRTLLTVELGLQTIHEKTAEWMRRGYGLPVFAEAVKKLRERNITVVVHVILGLKDETKDMMLETIRYLNHMDIQGIKLQLLHVIEGTDLADEYLQGAQKALSKEEYIDLLIACLENLSPDIVIHRLTGDGPSDRLIAPMWSVRKREVLNQIHHEMKLRESFQGKCFTVN